VSAAPDEAIGQRIHMLIPNHRPDEGDEILRLIQSGQQVTYSETERVRGTGLNAGGYGHIFAVLLLFDLRQHLSIALERRRLVGAV